MDAWVCRREGVHSQIDLVNVSAQVDSWSSRWKRVLMIHFDDNLPWANPCQAVYLAYEQLQSIVNLHTVFSNALRSSHIFSPIS